MPRGSGGMRLSPLFVLVLGALATIAPLYLWAAGSALLASTYGRTYQPFELLGFTVSLAAIAAAVTATRGRIRLGPEEATVILPPLLLAFHFLQILTEYSERSWDYRCYESAARALAAGGDPYAGCYLYPPALAQILEAVAAASRWLPAARGILPPSELPWFLTFYLYQAAQLAAVGAAYFLLVEWGRRRAPSPAAVPVLAALLLVFDNPVLRTLRHNQVNLFVLDLVLAAVLLAPRRPLLAGALAALGAHLKLLPVLVFAEWCISGRRRAAAAFLGAAATMAAASLAWHPGAWLGFVHSAGRYATDLYFRDNSVHGLLYQLARLTGAEPAHGLLPPWWRAVWLILAAALILWMAARLRARRAAGRSERELGDVGDWLAASLLLSPLSWEHHYVFALPLGMAAAEVGWRTGRPLPWIGLFATFVPPTFDVFPFSYHRMAGLLIMLAACSPARRAKSAARIDGLLAGSADDDADGKRSATREAGPPRGGTGEP